MLAAEALAMPVADKTMVQDGVDPAAQVAATPPLMPARERALKAVLHQIVGSLAIPAKQAASKPTQPGNVRLKEFGLVSDSSPGG
jgi:hypothetical protein